MIYRSGDIPFLSSRSFVHAMVHAGATPGFQAGLLTFPLSRRPSHPENRTVAQNLPEGFPSQKGGITATGSSPTLTGFPIKPLRHLIPIYCIIREALTKSQPNVSKRYTLVVPSLRGLFGLRPTMEWCRKAAVRVLFTSFIPSAHDCRLPDRPPPGKRGT